MPRQSDMPKILNVLDSNGDEIGFDEDRVQISIMFDTPASHRVNIVVVDGKVHIEQFILHGDDHIHSTIVDLVH